MRRRAALPVVILLITATQAWAKGSRFEMPEIPNAFRDAPAVVLLDANSSTLFLKYGQSTVHWKQRRILIQKEEGLGAADQVFEYRSGDGQFLRSFKALYYPPGQSKGRRIDKDFIRKETAVAVGRKGIVGRVKVTYPGAEVGGVIEWTAEWESEQFEVDHHWYLQGALPRIHTSYLIGFAGSGYGSRRLVYWSRQRKAVGQLCDWEEVTDNGSQKESRLACRNVPAFEDEPASPPESETRLSAILMITWRGRDKFWDMYTRYLRALYSPFLDHEASIETVVDKLREQPNWEGNELAEVHRWVDENIELRRDRDCRIFYLDREQEAREREGRKKKRKKNRREKEEEVDRHLRCMDAAGVIAAGFGDTYEVAFAQYALLKEAGLDVDFGFATDRRRGYFSRQAQDVIPHVPVLVVQGEENDTGAGPSDTVIDVTCRECRLNFPRWFLTGPGSAIHLFTHSGTHITRIRERLPRYSWTHRQDVMTLRADGSYELNVGLGWSGHPELERRISWREKSEEERLGELSDALGCPEDAEISIHGLDDPVAALRASCAYEDSHGVQKIGDLLLVPAPAGLTSTLPFPLTERRHHPIDIPYGRTLKVERRVSLPPGFEVRELPADTSVSVGPLHYAHSWTAADAQSVTFTALMRLDAKRVKVADYAALRDAVWDIESKVQGGLLIGPAPPESEGDGS